MEKKDQPKESGAVSQADRFRAAAHALECDDDADRFDARLKKVAGAVQRPLKAPTGPKAE